MITRKQYKKLKSIYRSNGTTAKDFDRNRDLYYFLIQKGYIYKCHVRGFAGYIVTQEGEVEMKIYKEDLFRFWVTTIVSFAALVVSIIAIALKV